MRVLLAILILLAFPVLELWLLIELGGRYGWWLLGYLILVAILGWRLIIDEKLFLFTRMAQTLREGGTPARALFGSAKNVIAGILLILPGIISDALAAVLLLVPAPRLGRRKQQAGPNGSRAANDDVIEGEYRRED